MIPQALAYSDALKTNGPAVDTLARADNGEAVCWELRINTGNVLLLRGKNAPPCTRHM